MEDLERLLVDWEREIIFHCKSTLHLEILLNHSCNSLSCNSCIYEASFCIVSWLYLIFCTENSSTRNLRSSLQFIHFMDVPAFSCITSSFCGRNSSLRDSSYPQCPSFNSNRCFIKSDLASASKWSLLPSRRDVAAIAGLENSEKSSLLPKTCWCLKGKSSLSAKVSWFNLFWLANIATIFPVLIGSWDELDIKFLVQSDKLVTVPRVLLDPKGTVVEPAEHEVAHRPSPNPGAVSRCFPQNRRSMLCSVGGRVGGWHANPRVQQDPGIQLASWAHNLWRVVAQPKRHSDVAVDVRRVYARWEVHARHVRKIKKECPWSV